jgi:uncharacterized membrane protein YgdD (TMEM256/DUF423 family)
MDEHSGRAWLIVGALLGGLAVACGAFGAHGLESHLASSGSGLTTEDERLLEVWETAARYQMYHALALLAVGFIAGQRSTRSVWLAGASMTLGTITFSGCLYALVLTGQKWLGAVVPIGGSLMIVGWGCLLISLGIRNRSLRR